MNVSRIDFFWGLRGIFTAVFIFMASGMPIFWSIGNDNLSPSEAISVNTNAQNRTPPDLNEPNHKGWLILPYQDQYVVTRNPRWDSEQRKWETFEAEFGLANAESSAGFLSQLELAKYQLDRTVFLVDDLIDSLEQMFEYQYNFASGQWRRNDNTGTQQATNQSPSQPWYMLDNVSLRSEIDIDLSRSEAFIGLRLTMPVGD